MVNRHAWFRHARRDRLAAVLVPVGLTGYVLVVYLVVVLGGGTLVGRTESPDLTLSILATAAVALSFERARRLVERVVAALVHPGLRSPYDVLSTFTSMVTGTALAGDAPLRVARALTEGLAAQWTRVWLLVDGTPTLAAVWPGSGAPEPAESLAEDVALPGRHVRRIHQAGELLGLLVVQEREGAPLTATEERLLADLADQAGLVLRGVRLRTELQLRLGQLSARAEELRASRRRLVDAQDAERRRLERDIHDGAQQHLVALTVNLRLAHTASRRSPQRGAALLAGQEHAVEDAIETLLSLSRGIYPSRLVSDGIAAALRTVAETAPVPVDVVGGETRYDAGVEAAAYFCCTEALQNAVKHSGASRIEVALREDGGQLICSVTDDGIGIDTGFVAGSGLANMRDRAEATGGAVVVGASPTGGTCVEVRLPATRPATEHPR